MGNPKQKWTAEEEEALRAGDKWRNLSGGPGGHGSREKSRASKPKPSSDGSQGAVVVKQTALPKPLVDDSSKSFAPNRYNEMIIEAISALKEPNGSDNRAIVGYIEQRQEVPQSFKKQLCSRLKRLVAIEKLEKS
ncbi:telomere repeat-binding factor 4-like [Gossypium australe]|uniref:Telomere repeat-binding factor 4-like n=1 Tax=Gossypium australe TaxID=47621 RepID=A0A5B6UJA9_9ROSI|nr:telomere repeat-binding factor 4-like [Gossypium australe]